MPGHEWDLKSNPNTIFGVAWKYDQEIKSKTGGDNDTYFQFRGLSENGKLSAADFGNYHAGYTGIMARVSQEVRYQFAGLGEVAKSRSFGDVFHRLGELWKNRMPYGDQRSDFHYNTDGMVDAARVINGTR